eukprot:TRINITY_DN104377_c0_g1_i1.p1 TRINITY_DN104377_c0_g1~~TRINITY_DN104377_c0_g1_i1.p1  ORF type:complete len:341 (+),score=32.00 TRINITY_DN104377_c0_g1_i1:31-1023(+)
MDLHLWSLLLMLPRLLIVWVPCMCCLAARRCFVWLRQRSSPSTTTQLLTSSRPVTSPQKSTGMLAVVIPCHNVAEKVRQIIIRACEFSSDPTLVKLFAIDSGSTDGTWAILQELKKDGVVEDVSQCSLGRCSALNIGAAVAAEHFRRMDSQLEFIMFLHSDTLIPRSYDVEIRDTLQDDDVSLGYFRFSWDGVEGNLPMLFNQWYVNRRCHWFQLPWGDQAYFMRFETFERAGGFPAIPLMEDTALLLSCERLGSVRSARSAVATRPIKFVAESTDWSCLNQMVRNHVLIVLWLFGVISAKDVYLRYYVGKPLPECITYADARNRVASLG